MESEKDIKKIREMLEFLVKKEIYKDLKNLSPKEKELYELTGKIGQNEIIKKMKMSSKTISKIWKDMEEKGLLKKEGTQYKKII